MQDNTVYKPASIFQAVSMAQISQTLEVNKSTIYKMQNEDKAFYEMVVSQKRKEENSNQYKYNLYDVYNYRRYIKAKDAFRYYIWEKIIDITDTLTRFSQLADIIMPNLYKPDKTKRVKFVKRIYFRGFVKKVTNIIDVYEIALNIKKYALSRDACEFDVKIGEKLIMYYKQKVVPSEFVTFYNKFQEIGSCNNEQQRKLAN